jgi:lipopolysaccharide/colanic/teichoic acid biosynthesis glycosyltransferase
MGKQVPFYDLRFTVKPGLTGWAQVNFSYAGSVEEQFEKTKYDLFYVQNANMPLDLRIVILTLKTVLQRTG